jgi:AcrR family transcriptional regulator
MSPRPRQATDEDMLRATFRAIMRLGPARLTLADVAGEAGVSAPAVVQRFGSKRGLLLAAAADAAGGSDYIFPALRARYPSPRAALLGLAECMTLMGSTPSAVANTLAFLHLDLTDADFHRHAVVRAEGMDGGLRALVEDAIEAGELRRCDAGRLARALQATLNGSLLNWAVQRRGRLASWIRRDLQTVLDPYAAGGSPAFRGRDRRRRTVSGPSRPIRRRRL